MLPRWWLAGPASGNAGRVAGSIAPPIVRSAGNAAWEYWTHSSVSQRKPACWAAHQHVLRCGLAPTIEEQPSLNSWPPFFLHCLPALDIATFVALQLFHSGLYCLLLRAREFESSQVRTDTMTRGVPVRWSDKEARTLKLPHARHTESCSNDRLSLVRQDIKSSSHQST